MTLQRVTLANGFIGFSSAIHGSRTLSPCLLLNINGKEYSAGYSAYSWHWYLFDPKDGHEVASISKRMFDACMRPFVVHTIIPLHDTPPFKLV